MKSFWDLDSKEREDVINYRYYKTKYIVWDYAPSADGIFGTMEKLPMPTMKGSIHGFVMKDSNVKKSCKWNNINVYTDAWYCDETWENRTIHPFHLFTTLEKAKAYSAKAIENLNKTITLEDILPIVEKYDASARITEGCRGYESHTYKCLTFRGGYYTMQIANNDKSIYWRGGTWDNDVIVPHIDLLDKCLDIKLNGRGGEDGYNDLLEYSIEC